MIVYIENENILKDNKKASWTLFKDINTTYGFGEFKSIKEVNLGENYKSNIWYSFDEDTNNFHIVPDISIAAEYQQSCNNFYLELRNSLHKNNYIVTKRASRKSNCTQCHNYLEVKKENFSYLINFQSLTCTINNQTKYNKIKCCLGKIQFFAFSSDYKGPNFDKNGNFKMMYPVEGGKEYTSDKNTGHCVKNTNFEVPILKDKLYLKQKSDKVVEEFIKFIEKNEEYLVRNRIKQ